MIVPPWTRSNPTSWQRVILLNCLRAWRTSSPLPTDGLSEFKMIGCGEQEFINKDNDNDKITVKKFYYVYAKISASHA